MKFKISLLFTFCFFLSSCTSQTVTYVSDKGLYQSAMSAYYAGRYNEAETQLQKISDDFNNSAYKNFSYLTLADNHLSLRSKESLRKSTSFYQIYLEQASTPYYIPYALENLIIISLKNNANQIFIPKLRSNRAHSYFQNIIDDYYRFSLLYPESVYFLRAKNYYQLARDYLANHEFEVANWYFSKKLYYSAILRYNDLLKNYSNFHKKEEAFVLLVESYKRANLVTRYQELKEFD